LQEASAAIPGLAEQGRHSFGRVTQPTEIAQVPHGIARGLMDLPPRVDATLTKQRLGLRAVRQRGAPFPAQVLCDTPHEARVSRYPYVFELLGQPLALGEQPVDALSRRLAGGTLER